MKETTFQEFHNTGLRLLNLLSHLTEEQLNYQPDQGWSAGQLADHLLKSYAFVRTLNGETRVTIRPIDQKLEPVKIMFADDSLKMESPKAIIPTNEKINKEAIITGLQKKIEQIEKVIKTEDLSLTCIDFAIPEYGEFTRYEWIWFNIYHTQRHIRQLENIVKTNNLIQ
ncbi:conserved hypothetical protein [Sphingobacterium sp. PM2-P1-29]|nr:conserved hypothetical protein [Sphingobacterium sp. PM2-P1-29]